MQSSTTEVSWPKAFAANHWSFKACCCICTCCGIIMISSGIGIVGTAAALQASRDMKLATYNDAVSAWTATHLPALRTATGTDASLELPSQGEWDISVCVLPEGTRIGSGHCGSGHPANASATVRTGPNDPAVIDATVYSDGLDSYADGDKLRWRSPSSGGGSLVPSLLLSPSGQLPTSTGLYPQQSAVVTLRNASFPGVTPSNDNALTYLSVPLVIAAASASTDECDGVVNFAASLCVRYYVLSEACFTMQVLGTPQFVPVASSGVRARTWSTGAFSQPFQDDPLGCNSALELLEAADLPENAVSLDLLKTEAFQPMTPFAYTLVPGQSGIGPANLATTTVGFGLLSVEVRSVLDPWVVALQEGGDDFDFGIPGSVVEEIGGTVEGLGWAMFLLTLVFIILITASTRAKLKNAPASSATTAPGGAVGVEMAAVPVAQPIQPGQVAYGQPIGGGGAPVGMHSAPENHRPQPMVGGPPPSATGGGGYPSKPAPTMVQSITPGGGSMPPAGTAYPAVGADYSTPAYPSSPMPVTSYGAPAAPAYGAGGGLPVAYPGMGPPAGGGVTYPGGPVNGGGGGSYPPPPSYG